MQPFVSFLFDKWHLFDIIKKKNRINDIDELPELGLYLNDLNPHGLSKEMVLAGWQHNSK